MIFIMVVVVLVMLTFLMVVAGFSSMDITIVLFVAILIFYEFYAASNDLPPYVPNPHGYIPAAKQVNA